jgi:hypothetical protein
MIGLFFYKKKGRYLKVMMAERGRIFVSGQKLKFKSSNKGNFEVFLI